MRSSLPISETISGDEGNGDEGSSVGRDSCDRNYPSPPAPYGFDLEGKPRKRQSRTYFTDLPHVLHRVSAKSLRLIETLVSLPLDKVTDARLRAMVTGAGIAIGSKIRVDEASLRVQHNNDVLERLGKLIREAEKVIPKK